MGEAAAEESQRPAPMRIYVGGLGERVTEEELRGIFGSKNLGRVEGVDIIRTKGRSFAYCDFVPSSSASLSKLLSMYNGCVWKGGKLKLEKAKEHFLVRLKHEWEEDAAPACPPDDASNADEVPKPTKKPKKSFNPDSQIKIFFPRLRKVKPLPLKGTGKHKYSFQRVEALPYPKHFCDCEEHSDPSLPSREEQRPKPESLDGGVDAEEFDLMRSVMNKLFEKEMGSQIPKDELKLAEEEVAEGMDVDEAPHEDTVEEASEEDEDGLVINMARSSGNTRTSMNKIENKISIPKRQKTELVRDESCPSSLKVEKTNKLSPKNGVRTTTDVDGVADVLSSFTTKQVKKSKDQSETRAKWSQKSSWRELLGDKTKSSFTVSDILPGAGSDEHDDEESDENESDEQNEDDSDEHDGEESDEHDGEESDDHDDEESNERESDGPDSVDSEDREFDRCSVEVDSVVGEDHESNKPSDELDPVDSEDHEMDNHEISGDPTVEFPEPKVPTGVHLNESYTNSGRGASWLKKSSWIQLVADSQKQSFSLSRMWSSDRNQETQDRQDDTAVTNDKQGEDGPPMALAIKEETPRTSSLSKEPNNRILQTPVESNPESSHKHEEKGVMTADRLPLRIGEECLFMRSSASLRDWAKSKAALTGSRKRKKL